MENEVKNPTLPEPSADQYMLVARDGQQMATARDQMLAWLVAKVADQKAEIASVQEAAVYAKKHKWSHRELDKQVVRGEKRLTFYAKVMEAVQAGYTIVPNIPVDVFAIRVDRALPNSLPQWNYDSKAFPLDESVDISASGKGMYVSPEPRVHHQWSPIETKNSQGQLVSRDKWTATPVAFKDPEFPVIALVPEVVQATKEAMALKLFDQFGISPQGRQRRKGDPLIIGQILDAADNKTVSFIIAWYLDLRDL